MAKLRLIWESWRSSLWFVPTLLVLGALVLAQVLIEVDQRIDRTSLQAQWPRLFGAGAAGSRGMLTAIASSMITVAGVAFSITIVALALASSQYTSRILRNFMRDRASQTVLGAFVSIFVYCLVVLRSIRGGDEGAFVPSVAVLFAVVLAFVGIGCLMQFFSSSQKKMGQVAMVRLGDTDLRLLGFVTRQEFGGLPAGIGDENKVAVYLPMSFQLGGFTVMVPREAIEPVAMSIEEAMKFALTAGVTTRN